MVERQSPWVCNYIRSGRKGGREGGREGIGGEGGEGGRGGGEGKGWWSEQN